MVLKKIYTGRVKQNYGFWCLEREGHGRVSKGMLETERGHQVREKEKVSGDWARIKRV